MANTKLDEIYRKFSNKISDYTFLNVSAEELESEFRDYLDTSIAEFYRCRNNLDIDEENQEFKSELTRYEKEILVRLMMKNYMHPQLLSSETIRQSLSDADFKIYSQSAHLRELNLMYNRLKREADRMIRSYTYFDLGDKS